MVTIIRVKEWKKKKDPKRGEKLQTIANRMLKKGNTGRKYKKIRTAAEFHLGFWAWQRKGPNYGKTPTGIWRSQTDALLPRACVKAKCPYLPAGSAACIHTGHECP